MCVPAFQPTTASPKVEAQVAAKPGLAEAHGQTQLVCLGRVFCRLRCDEIKAVRTTCCAVYHKWKVVRISCGSANKHVAVIVVITRISISIL